MADPLLENSENGDRDISAIDIARYHALMNSSSVAIIILSADQKITGFNEAMCHFIGYPAEELKHLSLQEITFVDDQEESQRLHTSLIMGEEDSTGQKRRFIKKDGALVWGDVGTQALRNGAGIVIETLATITNITATKTAEETLRQRQQLLKHHLDNAPLAAIEWDRDFRCTSWNAAAERIFGFTRDEAIGQSGLDLIVTDSFRPLASEIFESVLAESGGNESLNDNITRDGRIITCEWFNTPLWDSNGQIIGVASLVHDITKQEEQKNIFRRFYEIMPDVFMVTSLENGTCVDVNEGFCRMTGYSREDVIGKITTNLALWEHDADRLELVNGLKEYGVVNNLSATFRCKDGTLWPGMMSACQILMDGRPHILSSTKDVSDIHQSRQEAIDANHSKSSFLANMSHEIRTPMNGIVGIVDLLQNTKLDDDQQQMLQTARDSAFALLGIINDILDFSKIEAGKLELEKISISIRDIVEGVVETLIPDAAKKGLRLVSYIDPNIPALVLSDPVRIRQILFNLAGNAIKFTENQADQPGQVSIRAERQDDRIDDAPMITFTIKDNGIGMSDAVISKLFNPFTQAEDSTTRLYGGTGLGLSITSDLVDLLGGTIEIASKEGKGSTFYINVPFPFASEAIAEEAVEEPDISGLRILVAVNLPSSRYNVSHYLQAGRATVAQVDSPEAVSDILVTAAGNARPFDILIVESNGDGKEHDERLEELRNTPSLDNLRYVVLCQDRLVKKGLVGADKVIVRNLPLRLTAFNKAIAIAGGRASPESREDKRPWAAAGPPPSIEAAEAAETLILVIEDNVINQDVIRRQLDAMGYACELASNGAVALTMMESRNYAVMLTDCHMPVMDGYELTRTVRQKEEGGKHHIPIIAITANATKGEREACLAMGMDDYLLKPLEMRLLWNALQVWAPAGGSSDAPAPAIPDKQKPQKGPLLDTTFLTDSFGDDPELIREILQGFVDPATEIIHEIMEAWERTDDADVGEKAHKLKSASRAIGALALADLCFKLEKAGEKGDKDCIEKNMRQLKPLFDQVILHIQEF